MSTNTMRQGIVSVTAVMLLAVTVQAAEEPASEPMPAAAEAGVALPMPPPAEAVAVPAEPEPAAAEEPLPQAVEPEPEEAEPAAPVDTVPVEQEPISATQRGDMISITLNDVEMTDVINMFIRISGANIIATPTNLTGRVTVSLKDVEWKAALTAILEMNNLTLVRSTPDVEVYSILPKPEGAAEPMFIETFLLKYKRPEALSEGVKLLLAPNGQLLHASGNMMSVLGTSKHIEDVRSLVEDIDLRVPQVVIEAKFVELNNQAIEDIGLNWQILQGYTVGADNLQWSQQNERSITESDARTRRDYRNASNTRTRDRTSGGTGDTTTMGNTFFDINGNQYEETSTTYEEQPPGSGVYVPVITRTPTTETTVNNVGSSASTLSVIDSVVSGTDQERTQSRDVSRTFSELQSAVLSADAFSLTLSALKQLNGADVISNPKLIVASGETASIHVGRQDPEIRAVADNNLQGRLTYERSDWIESGVRMEVTPIVNTEDVISVIIKPVLSRVIGFQESGDTRVQIPILSTREIVSQFNLPSGKTVAIGGLTETQDQEQVKKVPFLGDIPIIGKYLFTHTHKERVQDEVIVFVTMALAHPEELETNAGVPTQETLLERRVTQDEAGRFEFIERDPKKRRAAERKEAEAAAAAAAEAEAEADDPDAAE